MKRTIKSGEIFTVPVQAREYSNTYHAGIVSPEKVWGTHPLAPKLYIEFPLDKINTAPVQGKGPIENCLFFANSQRTNLSGQDKDSLDALIYFFVARRYLSSSHKYTLSQLLGKLAKAYFEGVLANAARFCTQNVALLDEYNLLWYNKNKDVFSDPTTVASNREKTVMFNITGFLLAQIHNGAVK